jgi:hypothetical protein
MRTALERCSRSEGPERTNAGTAHLNLSCLVRARRKKFRKNTKQPISARRNLPRSCMGPEKPGIVRKTFYMCFTSKQRRK